jgi:hypothetical protein
MNSEKKRKDWIPAEFTLVKMGAGMTSHFWNSFKS